MAAAFPPPPDDRADGPPPPDDRADGTPPPDDRADGTPPPDDRADGLPPPHDRADGTPPPDDRADGPPPPDDRADGPPPPDDRADGTRSAEGLDASCINREKTKTIAATATVAQLRKQMEEMCTNLAEYKKMVDTGRSDLIIKIDQAVQQLNEEAKSIISPWITKAEQLLKQAEKIMDRDRHYFQGTEPAVTNPDCAVDMTLFDIEPLSALPKLDFKPSGTDTGEPFMRRLLGKLNVTPPARHTSVLKGPDQMLIPHAFSVVRSTQGLLLLEVYPNTRGGFHFTSEEGKRMQIDHDFHDSVCTTMDGRTAYTSSSCGSCSNIVLRKYAITAKGIKKVKGVEFEDCGSATSPQNSITHVAATTDRVAIAKSEFVYIYSHQLYEITVVLFSQSMNMCRYPSMRMFSSSSRDSLLFTRSGTVIKLNYASNEREWTSTVPHFSGYPVRVVYASGKVFCISLTSRTISVLREKDGQLLGEVVCPHFPLGIIDRGSEGFLEVISHNPKHTGRPTSSEEEE